MPSQWTLGQHLNRCVDATLRSDLPRRQGRNDASLDARGLRFGSRVQTLSGLTGF
jgi:hypothetical protein